MRSDITPDMHTKRRATWARVEAEFQEPFWGVVQGFADMGYGKYATARAIGLNPSSFCKMLAQVGQHIRWPAYADLATWKDPAPRDAEYRRLISEGRRRSGKGIFWVQVNGQRMTATEAAQIAGVATVTIMRRYRKGLRGEALIAPPMSRAAIAEKARAAQLNSSNHNPSRHPWRRPA